MQSSYQAFKFAAFNIGWFGNWNCTVRFCSKTSLEKRRGSRNLLYFTWSCWYIPNLALNHIAKVKERRSWIPFKIWTTEAAKVVPERRWWWWLQVSPQLSGSQQTTSIKGVTIFIFKTFVHKIYSWYAEVPGNEDICRIQSWNLVYGPGIRW